MDYLKLGTIAHSSLHFWLDQERISIKITDFCHVPILIDKFYEDFIACDVIDINACHIPLGRSWQHDIDATHRGKKTFICSFGRTKELSGDQLHRLQSLQKKKNLNSYPYVIETSF